jgi:hypothetical protein
MMSVAALSGRSDSSSEAATTTARKPTFSISPSIAVPRLMSD